MLMIYQFILIIIILISFLFAIVPGEAADKELAVRSTALCIAALLSFIVSSIFL